MDKSKIIDYIISEWALRSHDGLASGHDTDANVAVLREILNENGLDENDIMELSALMEKNPSKKATAQPESLERGDDIRFTRKENEIFRHYGSPQGKDVRPDDVDHVKNSIHAYDKSRKFTRLYNKLDLATAIQEYGKHDSVINAIDGRERKGLGRGELVFIFMLKDYRSGGTADVDLLYAEASGNIEMKELTGKSKKTIMKISAPTLTGYSASAFKAAVDELSVALHREPDLGPFLERVLVGTKEGTSEPLYPSKDAKSLTTKQVSALKEFLAQRKTTEMSVTLFSALEIIIQKLNASDANIPKDKVSAARANIVVGRDNQEFRVENPQDVKRDMEKASLNPTKGTNINLKVSLGTTKNDAELEQLAKSLSFFKDNYTIDKISAEITKLVGGKYSGLLVIDKRGKNTATFYPKGTPFRFVGLTMNGIKVVPANENVTDVEAADA